MIKIALNGGKSKEENPNLPVTLEEYKQEIDWFQAHGLHDFHIHFRDPAGLDTLLQKYVQSQWEALKSAFPGCRIGMEDITCDEHGHELTSNVALYQHALEI